MNRIPGKPENKLKILQNIDERQFPYLVADILHISFGHTEVKVMDGPFDGKRDIHSIDTRGNAFITQCKYHNDMSATVGTRETDELILALAKFGSKAGAFATSGRLTPPSKREYIDNFPQYNLKFFEGVDIIDHVLSNPILSAVWYSDERLESTRYKLVIPFICRKIEKDVPYLLDSETHIFLSKDYQLSLVKEKAFSSVFAPYRAPHKTSFNEFSSNFYCQHIVCSGAIYAHKISDLVSDIQSIVCEKIGSLSELQTLRFGKPFFSPNTEKFNQRTEIDIIEPKSFIVDKKSLSEEYDWIIPDYRSDWKFPDRFGQLQAEWACWHNEKLNCNFVLEIDTPTVEYPNFFSKGMNDLKKAWVQDSLFIQIPEENLSLLINALKDESKPNWECKYGRDDLLIGWLHPRMITNKHLVVDYDGEGLMLEINLIDNEFNNQKNKIISILDTLEIPQTRPDRAILIAAANDMPFFQDVEIVKYRTAELYHFFEDTPSPIYLPGRNGLFVTMWEIPSSLDEIMSVLKTASIDIQELPLPIEIHTQVHSASQSKHPFAMVTFKFDWPLNLSTDEYLNIITPHLERCIGKVTIFLKDNWKESKIATNTFWQNEIGIIFNT